MLLEKKNQQEMIIRKYLLYLCIANFTYKIFVKR